MKGEATTTAAPYVSSWPRTCANRRAPRLSPLKLTRALSDADMSRLYDATRATLLVWIDHLRRDAAGGFPEKVTAFREEMAVHGRFKQPCPVCGTPVQRIVYAEKECNYCARCQTGGRRLADPVALAPVER